ncbi:uncharacterized protein LOC141628303 [Silene latifolia]|uniref:uncharacterized protein LOC141628303 n=1 Tax=Silene latifolia TaxID=37657 RepID=UPI003D78A308
MEVYIDDRVVKSKQEEKHMTHLENTFGILRKYHIKLNPLKCTFGKPKDIQRLTGRVAAFNRFISRSSDRCRLFYDILRKCKRFEWMEGHEKAFDELKSYLSTPPLLYKPEPGEPLYLYLSVTEVAVSVVLVWEHEGAQKPVYYISKSLLPAETRYTSLEKLVLALADKDVLTLSEDKGEQRWVLYVDGASNMRGIGVGLVLCSPQREQIIQAVRCEFKATNNEAEYEALILGLQLALDLRVSQIEVYNDSQLIVNHVNDLYVATDSKMVTYLKVAKDLKLRFATFFIKQIPRDQNAEADALTTLGVTFKPGVISTIPIVHVLEPAIS